MGRAKWRSKQGRNLCKEIEDADGTWERVPKSDGRIRITGPGGKLTINEPGPRDRTPDREQYIYEKTGLRLRQRPAKKKNPA